MHSTIGLTTALLLFVSQSSALFNCNDDQNAFPPTPGKFVVHYTSIRDTSTGKPWVRVCRPAANGNWDQSGVLESDCSAKQTTHDKQATGLKQALTVIDGNGCNSDSSNLDGAIIEYGSQNAVLQAPVKGQCGPRNHGISCQFNL
ncbi:hypothetical protein B0H16DRAFT_1023377 [Mycena metata]|uniref:Uncharacterized protein n=1 Tax=Mycena metata TaxID=1033252 RepID=A0AAD7MT24_9AGAR|nr:hypothetical protein B0H16DRAFT_1468775 [Mycena metata]KAJ7742231.1 hypothetical protein B0H16DRAFT_1023377 [Mycena metata]